MCIPFFQVRLHQVFKGLSHSASIFLSHRSRPSLFNGILSFRYLTDQQTVSRHRVGSARKAPHPSRVYSYISPILFVRPCERHRGRESNSICRSSGTAKWHPKSQSQKLFSSFPVWSGISTRRVRRCAGGRYNERQYQREGAKRRHGKRLPPGEPSDDDVLSSGQ